MVQYANADVLLTVKENARNAEKNHKDMRDSVELNNLDIDVCRKSHERVIKTNNEIKVIIGNDSF